MATSLTFFNIERFNPPYADLYSAPGEGPKGSEYLSTCSSHIPLIIASAGDAPLSPDIAKFYSLHGDPWPYGKWNVRMGIYYMNTQCQGVRRTQIRNTNGGILAVEYGLMYYYNRHSFSESVKMISCFVIPDHKYEYFMSVRGNELAWRSLVELWFLKDLDQAQAMAPMSHIRRWYRKSVREKAIKCGFKFVPKTQEEMNSLIFKPVTKFESIAHIEYWKKKMAWEASKLIMDTYA